MFTRLTYVCRTNRGLTSGYMWHICPVPGKSDTYIPLNRHERRPTTRARNRYKIRVPEILLAPQRWANEVSRKRVQCMRRRGASGSPTYEYDRCTSITCMCSHGTSGNILPLILTLLIMVSRAKATLVMRAAKLMGQRPSLRRRPSDSEAELCDERSEGRKPSKN
jgi:hypothetical protein